MRRSLLIIPGYGVGLSGLGLITYRTLLALGTESKSLVLQVNQFGEQYLDLACLVVLWAFSVIGMIALSGVLKETPTQVSDEPYARTPFADTAFFPDEPVLGAPQASLDNEAEKYAFSVQVVDHDWFGY